MKIYHFKFCKCDRQQSKIYLLILITIFNFCFGLFLISSVISFTEKDKISSEFSIESKNKIEQIQQKSITIKSMKFEYENYFRINYKIIKNSCKLLYLFNTTKNILSIQNLTNFKLQKLFSKNVTININIIQINPIIIKTDKIHQSGIHKSIRTVCDYLIELYIGLDFSFDCNNDCRLKEIKSLTLKSRPFGDLLDNSFLFLLYPINSFESIIKLNINQMLIFRSSIYYNKLIYIRSFYEIRYISGLIIDADGSQSSVTMSQVDRSLFLIKDGLDENIFENDCSTIYISLLSISTYNTYLRHESGRIKLGKNNKLSLFKQDSTFKLLFSQTNKNLIAFESINLPQFYIGIDQETQTALVLAQPEQQTQLTNIHYLDKRFLFKFIYQE